MNNKNIKIESISKNYSDLSGHTIQIFENISFNIEAGKVTTILAPVGKGKTSLLKSVANIGKIKNGLNKKRIYIPKEPSSFPWLNVRENILFNLDKTDESIFKNIIKYVGLDGYEDHYPNNYSFGFRFRISFARAICPASITFAAYFIISAVSVSTKIYSASGNKGLYIDSTIL